MLFALTIRNRSSFFNEFYTIFKEINFSPFIELADRLFKCFFTHSKFFIDFFWAGGGVGHYTIVDGLERILILLVSKLVWSSVNGKLFNSSQQSLSSASTTLHRSYADSHIAIAI